MGSGEGTRPTACAPQQAQRGCLIVVCPGPAVSTGHYRRGKCGLTCRKQENQRRPLGLKNKCKGAGRHSVPVPESAAEGGRVGRGPKRAIKGSS